MPDLLTVALGHAERGWHVFPLVPDSKRPVIDKWEQRATLDPARIRRAWSMAPFGIGIACGPSGLLVIDLDMRKPGQIAPDGHAECRHGDDTLIALCKREGQPTPTTAYAVGTGGGGAHLYFLQPQNGLALRNTQGRIGWLIDTRGHGGYVVAAGSTVAGKRYQLFIDDGMPGEVPGWLAERARPIEPLHPVGSPRVIGLPTGRRGAYLRAAVDRTLTKLGEAHEGGRNAALFMAAQTLGQLVAGGELAEETVTTALTDAAQQIGLREREITGTIRSGLRAGARRPRTVRIGETEQGR
ncbi:bifunctional DNA primase/polymerase [Actinoplanes sp. HUAS TT8]|uniref:bifunctional DNA primase/polymerase n=1 Tax=Actinoplanes sp. HUAS TT8 TaxID=3447453 RepID=UPI003F525081